MKEQDEQGEGSKDMESGEVFGEVWKYCMVRTYVGIALTLLGMSTMKDPPAGSHQ